MAATAWDRYSPTSVPAPPEIVEPGFKYSLSNVNAAVGVEQLKKLPEFLARRRRLARLYLRALAEGFRLTDLGGRLQWAKLG